MGYSNIQWFYACRSGHGGSMRGDDDTCSLPTTTWSGQQARTPIAVRRLGPLPPASTPHHHQGPPKPTAWLGRIAKLAALGAVVIISATGVIKVCSADHETCQSVCCVWLEQDAQLASKCMMSVSQTASHQM